jgi:signal transduction histidine kinase
MDRTALTLSMISPIERLPYRQSKSVGTLILFRITARTVLELGSELISSDIIAFYELIKNGFDAGTKNGVEVRFDIVLTKAIGQRLGRDALKIDPKDENSARSLSELKAVLDGEILDSASKDARAGFRALLNAAVSPAALADAITEGMRRFNTITIKDTGSGMSTRDLEDNFLVIGTGSRKKAIDAALASGTAKAPYLGEKGIGRLSAMRLGEQLRVNTAKISDVRFNVLEIDWKIFNTVDAMLDEIDVKPSVGDPKPSPEWSGTNIVIGDLTENWFKERVFEMGDREFSRLTDPFEDPGVRPRIAVFWNDDRVPVGSMSRGLLEAAHAHIHGKYSIVEGEPLLEITTDIADLGFPHPREIRTIVLNRADLDGAILGKDDHIDDLALIDVGPFEFEAHWFNRRRLALKDAAGEKMAIRDEQEKWSGNFLYRDLFRVFPYGEEEDDWLELDRRALRRSGYLLNRTQFVGRTKISRTANPALLDQTNREGLRVTPEQRVLLQVMRFAVQDQLGQAIGEVEKQYKAQKIDLGDAQKQVTKMEDRAKTALARIRRLSPPDADEAIADIQQTLAEFSQFAAQARERIAQVEQEGRQMVEMAGIGLMVEVVAHELARSTEGALRALEKLKDADVPDRLRGQIAILRAEMKSINKRVRVLDPMSISGRQRTELFSLTDIVKDAIDAHASQFERHRIRPIVHLPEKPVRIRAVKGMIVQILENLISNSVYWLDIRGKRESFNPEIRISVGSSPPSLIFEDNGRGIAVENREAVFKMFFSLRDSKRRRGLGLFIARDAAEHHGGTLDLDDQCDPQTGRLHRFILELPGGLQQ